MNKSRMGVGSASVILVFAVLCLTIFALISYTAANADKDMLDISMKSVHDYYKTDTFAESILAVILDTRNIGMPDTVEGINIYYENYGNLDFMIRYSCPVSETKNLYVEVLLDASEGGEYEILAWQLQEIGDWEADTGINLWIPD